MYAVCRPIAKENQYVLDGWLESVSTGIDSACLWKCARGEKHHSFKRYSFSWCLNKDVGECEESFQNLLQVYHGAQSIQFNSFHF